jgi:hypothetical protein
MLRGPRSLFSWLRADRLATFGVSVSSVTAVWSLVGVSSLIACSPTPAQTPTQSPLSTETPNDAASGAPGTPDASCGLPPSLLARGWPRELSPTRVSRPDVSAASETTHPDTAFTLGVLPDTQYYTLCRYPHFARQVQWLADNATPLKMRGAIHLGDITEHNIADEWTFAQTTLRSTVPTFLATGNHDYGDNGTSNRRYTLFADYFSDPLPPTATTVAEVMEPGNLENAYYRLSLSDVVPDTAPNTAADGLTLGVLVVEWRPRGRTVEWANQVLTKYPADRVVFVTHAYLYYDSTRYDWAAKGDAQEWNPHAYGDDRPADKQPADIFDGEKLWTSLVSQHANVFLTLNGHVLGDGTGLLTSRGVHGNVVHQVLVNYQMLDEGGLGYLRLLEFDKDGQTLRMRTYSPSLGVWATAPDQHFELTIAPRLW